MLFVSPLFCQSAWDLYPGSLNNLKTVTNQQSAINLVSSMFKDINQTLITCSFGPNSWVFHGTNGTYLEYVFAATDQPFIIWTCWDVNENSHSSVIIGNERVDWKNDTIINRYEADVVWLYDPNNPEVNDEGPGYLTGTPDLGIGDGWGEGGSC